MTTVMKNRIPELLKERGWTITQLQIKTGIGWPTVHAAASREVLADRTSFKTLRKIAEALGVGISDLYEKVEVSQEL